MCVSSKFSGHPIQIQCAAFVYVCLVSVCVLFCWFVFGCCHCSPVLLVLSASTPPPPLLFTLFSFPPSPLSLFWKRITGVLLNFYTFTPRILPIPGQLPLISSLQITFFLSFWLSFSLSVQGNAWNNCLSMCCGRGRPLQFE